MKAIDLTGQRFGSLIAKEVVYGKGGSVGSAFWDQQQLLLCKKSPACPGKRPGKKCGKLAFLTVEN